MNESDKIAFQGIIESAQVVDDDHAGDEVEAYFIKGDGTGDWIIGKACHIGNSDLYVVNSEAKSRLLAYETHVYGYIPHPDLVGLKVTYRDEPFHSQHVIPHKMKEVEWKLL